MKPDLHDADIERELARRASGEWRAERVLPAVERAMEVRTERISAPRWAALAGWAGLLGVLVVLAAALPRLPLVPADASPTPEGGAVVLSTEEFAAQLATGELRGQTVLVEGRIEGIVYDHDVQKGPPPCGPAEDDECLDQLGTLMDAEDVRVFKRWLAVPEPEASLHGGSRHGWQWWDSVEPPLAGTLLLSVDDSSRVVHGGHVAESGGDLVSTPADAAALDPMELELDEVILVHGWLTQVGGTISCAPPEPGTMLEGLPSKWCGNPAWIAPEPVAIDPSGFTIPDDFISVQHGADYQFAEDPAADEKGLLEPLRATYAIARRLYGGGCPDNQPPCWDWAIVARVSDARPSPTTTRPPEVSQATHTPAPETPPAEAPAGAIKCRPYVMGGSEPSPGPVGPILDFRVLDETHTIIDCAYFSRPDSPPSGPLIRKSFPDSSEMEVSWAVAQVCDASAELKFKARGDGYQLAVDPSEGTDCYPGGGVQGVVLWFNQPMAGQLIDAQLLTLVKGPPPMPNDVVCDLISPAAMKVAVRDHTDVVAGCTVTPALPHGVWTEDFDRMVVTRNPGGDPLRLQVMFVTTACDTNAEVTLDEVRGLRSAEVRLLDTYADCGGLSAYHTVTVELREPVNGFPMRVFLSSPNWPPESPPPLTELPRGTRCGYTWLGELVPSVGIVDHVGLVADCSAFVEEDRVPDPGTVDIRSPGGDQSRLEVSWCVDAFEQDMPAHLELMESLRGLALTVDRSEAAACERGAYRQGVEIILTRLILAVDIEALLAGHTAASATTAAGDGGSFTMTLRTGKAEYAAGEPIEVEAILAYEGPAEGILTLVGSGSGLVVFSLGQLDGDLAMGGLRTDDCSYYEVRASEPVVLPYRKSAGWSEDDPNADFYRNWVEDPEFTLPPGVWRITAYGEFYRGECGGRLIRLEASIVVTVR